ncbi:MAG TPA: flagellar biosynthesis anti-sigma factor FlgM [Solimonas sp.]
MTSKINGGQIDSYAPLARPSATPAGKSGGVPAHTDVPTSRGDSLSLTRDAQLLQLGASAANESSGIDTARVATVSAELANGSYKIDPQAIAARMIRSEWELYG